MSQPDPEMVAGTARLARLALSDGEKSKFAADLGRIFDLFAVLDDDAIRGKAPLAHPLGEVQPLREDTAVLRDMQESIAQNAPYAEAGFITVPKVIE